jgi:predicted TIM-barrel fold metal-dependent hydrolase
MTTPDTYSDHYLVISADTHGGGRILDYKPYLASKWHDEFDAWAAGFSDPWGHLQNDDIRGDWGSDRRVADLEADGIVAEVMFPNTVPPFYPTYGVLTTQPRTREEYERRWAGVQASNRWVADFCAQAPGRRRSFVQIFLTDVDDAVAEIRRGKDAGLGAVLVPGAPPNHPVIAPLNDLRYEPIWMVCEELGMPVNLHIGTGLPDMDPDRPGEGAVLGFEGAFFGHRNALHMICGGVFERHPSLHLAITETGLGWVGTDLPALDVFVAAMGKPGSAANLLGSETSKLPLTPSEYFRRNCYIGASFCLPSEIGARFEVGVDHVMWGSDYPHIEGTTPYSREALRATFADVPVEECRRMFGLNAAEMYGFESGFLTTIADRVGPTVAETHVPLDRYPEGSRLEDLFGPLPV